LSATAKIFLATALCAVLLGAFAQPPNTLPAREIARIDGEYSNLSVAKGMPAASVEYFAASFVIDAPLNQQPSSTFRCSLSSIQGRLALFRILL
jgi:hypothetical protein